MIAKRSHHAPAAYAARAKRYGLTARDRQRLVYALSALGDCREAVMRALNEEGAGLHNRLTSSEVYEFVCAALRRIVR